jgi:hypothetical protein
VSNPTKIIKPILAVKIWGGYLFFIYIWLFQILVASLSGQDSFTAASAAFCKSTHEEA